MDTWAKEGGNGGGGSGLNSVSIAAPNSGLTGNGTTVNPLKVCASDFPTALNEGSNDKIVVSTDNRPCGELLPKSSIKAVTVKADTGSDYGVSLGNTFKIAGDAAKLLKTTNTAGVTTVTIDTSTATLGQVPTVNASGDLVFVSPDPTHVPVTVTDTNSVNLTQSGVDNQTISADVKISSTAGNAIVTNPDGIYAPTVVVDGSETKLSAGTNITSITGLGTIASPYVINATTQPTNLTYTASPTQGVVESNTGTDATIPTVTAVNAGLATPAMLANSHVPVVTTDSSTVDFTQSGTDNQSITASVKVSATAGNAIAVNPDGLYVSPSTGELTTVSDTNTVNLTLTGVDITADTKISATAGNTIVANADGLYVPTPVAADGSETKVTAGTNITSITGSGTTASPYVVNAATQAGNTNLTTTSVTATNVTVSSDTGTDAILPTATTTTAGVMSAAQATLLSTALQAETPLTANDSGTIDFTTSGTSNHTLTGTLVGAATATNGQVPQSDGAGGITWVTPSAGHIAATVVDSTTIDFTASGVDNQTFTASAKISSTAGNDLTSDANGLFLDVQAAETTTTLTGVQSTGNIIGTYNNEDAVAAIIRETVTSASYNSTTKIISYVDEAGNTTNLDLSGLAADIFVTGGSYNATSGVLTLTDNSGTTPDVNIQLHVPVTVNDSSTVDFTASGTDNQTITAAVKLSATAGNVLVANADGLYVPTGAETTLTANDSSSIDFTTSGTSNHTLTGAVKISSTANNIATIDANGVYVPAPTGAETIVTAGTNVTVTGSGTSASPYVVNATPGAGVTDLSYTASPTNGIVVSSTGLDATVPLVTAVNAGLASPAMFTNSHVPVVTTDSTSIDFTQSGTDNQTITAVTKISATAGNSITINADGLYVPTAAAGATNLAYTASATNGIVTSDTGTDATIPLVDATNAGLASPAMFTNSHVPMTAVDSTTIDFTTSGIDSQTLTGAVIFSATAGNQATNNSGVYVAKGAGVTTTDTSTIDFTTTAGDITGSVKISATAGNDITANADGLFLDVQASETTTTLTGTLATGHTIGTYNNEDAVAVVINETVTSTSYNSTTKILSYVDENGATTNIDLSGLATDIFVNGATYNSSTGLLTLTDNSGTTPDVTVQIHPPVVANDSSTIDFTQSGTDGQTITAVAKISATAGNTITANADGLYAADTAFTATDSSTIDFTTSGTSGHTLTGDVKISATAGNTITANADGLYASAASLLRYKENPSTGTTTATATGTDAVAIGHNSSSTHTNAVSVGTGVVSVANNTSSFGGDNLAKFTQYGSTATNYAYANQFRGVSANPLTVVVGNVTVSNQFSYYVIDATAANRIATLPVASTFLAGSRITIKKLGTKTQTVTITPAGTDTIDRQAAGVTYVLSNDADESVDLISDGVNKWYII